MQLPKLNRTERIALTIIVAAAAGISAIADQPQWAHEVEAVILTVGAAFGIKPPHQE